jgi:EAL domain-containing protein (putative c-di-GMP-specific phosphodiesterase class I)/CheY-like chemotaxis protein
MANSKCQQTILVIEDGIANDGMLSLILATRGYKVVAAKNGQDAINKSRLPIDLIVLDLILPDMNGIEVCHYFKRAEVTRNVPVIILSERACGVDQKVQCFQLGADDFLCKPFDNEELLARIFALLRRHYGEEIHAESERFEHLKQLKHIVDHELIEPNFQPIYLLDRDSTCQLYGMEVLSRPLIDGALKNPEMLFEVALELGFYYELEMMVWKKALGVLSKNGPMPNIFFNCSSYLIENNKFPQVHKIFESFSVSPQNVFFELTERSAISQYALFCDRLQEFRDSGFKIAVDDVGSGYASLESIIETRPEVVKIDRHIIHGLTANSYKRSIVKFIVSFCCEHDIICVAEGVETAGEFALLKDLGVTAFQGYYFHKPAPLVDLNNFRKIAV